MNENAPTIDSIPGSNGPDPLPAPKASQSIKDRIRAMVARHKANPSKTVNTGQDEKGRFTAGNKFGGNKALSVGNQLRSAMYACVTVEDFQKIVQKAVKKAIDGDRYARDFIADRLLGRVPHTLRTAAIQVDPETAQQTLAEFFGIEADGADKPDKDDEG